MAEGDAMALRRWRRWFSKLVVKWFGDLPDQGASYWKARSLAADEAREDLAVLLARERVRTAGLMATIIRLKKEGPRR
jgi:hypothetical protein